MSVLPLLLLVTAPAPVALTTTVSFDLATAEFAVEGRWIVVNDADDPAATLPFELSDAQPLSVSSTMGAVLVDGRTLRFDPPIPSGTKRSFSFSTNGRPSGATRGFVRRDELFVNGGMVPYYPVLSGSARIETCVKPLDGWRIVASGDPRGPCFVAPEAKLVMIAGRRDPHVVEADEYRVFSSRANAANAEPLLDDVRAIVVATAARFGPRATKTLDLVELTIDGGYSMEGLVVVHGGVFRSMATDDAEGPFLAHELAHEWFGSIANGDAPLREGLPTYVGLEDARRRGRGDAYVESLIARADRARPGLTIRQVDGSYPGAEYDAVAYARAALAWDQLAQDIGRGRFDALVLRFLADYRGGYASIAQFLAPLDVIARDFDAAAYTRVTIDSDWNPRTNDVRPFVWTLDAHPFIAVMFVVLLVVLVRGWLNGRRRTIVVDPPLALIAAVLVNRVAWVDLTLFGPALLSVLVGGWIMSRWGRYVSWAAWILIAALRLAGY